MKYNSFLKIILFGFVCAFIATSCVKEGPLGPEGAAGKDGKDGKDANQTCIICHAPGSVDRISVEFQYSKHEEGEAAIEEAGNVGCTPCHAQEAFIYVVENKTPSTFVYNETTKRYDNKYAATPGTAYGRLLCATCHSSIHKTYASSDLPALTTTAAVPLTMWGGAKTVNLTADGGSSNLCVKCHQPRPQTNLQNGNVQDYVSVAANPKTLAFDAENPSATTNIVRPSYRMHIHYGSVGAIYAGVGGVEFAGSMQYTSSAHPAVASCKDCHMGPMYGTSTAGASGGHTFKAKGNLTTCNAAGCHSTPVTATSANLWVNPRNEIKGLLDALAAKLVVNGVEILNRDKDAETNLWLGLTKNNYDGYLNVYDPSLNPGVGTDNVTGPFQNAAPAGSWTAEQKAYNLSLPKLSLTNAQYGALINFQLCLREYSLGIHNYAYTKALLTNSAAVL
jgi:hypothetical protein